MKKTGTEWLISIVFFIVGLTIMVSGVVIQINNVNFLKTAIKTEATITELTRSTDSDGDSTYHVEVSFTVDNKTYSGTLGEYNSAMYEGGKTTIYYNPNNPSNFKSGSTGFIGYILLGFGAIFFIVGGKMILTTIKKKKLYKNLKINGRRVDAEITSIDLNTSYAVNGRNPYVISSTYVENGIVYNFVSDNLWVNLEPVIASNGIKTIPVYMDSNDPKKYIVDTDELNKYLGN